MPGSPGEVVQAVLGELASEGLPGLAAVRAAERARPEDQIGGVRPWEAQQYAPGGVQPIFEADLPVLAGAPATGDAPVDGAGVDAVRPRGCDGERDDRERRVRGPRQAGVAPRPGFSSVRALEEPGGGPGVDPLRALRVHLEHLEPWVAHRQRARRSPGRGPVVAPE